MKKQKHNISGLSLIEALVSVVIIGIGFVSILQMTNFSVQSIDNSGDRTKANFLTEMIVEDVIGSKNSFYGVNSDNENIIYSTDGTASLDGDTLNTFSKHLSDNGWSADLSCGGSSSDTNTPAEKKQNIYETQQVDAPRNKQDKWNTIFEENRFLKCKSTTEQKKLQVFEICKWDACDYKLDSIFEYNSSYPLKKELENYTNILKPLMSFKYILSENNLLNSSFYKNFIF